MPNTAHTQLSQNILPRRSGTTNGITTVRGVRQDKSASKRERVATPQPAPQKQLTRARQLYTNISRSQNYSKKHSNKRQMVQLTIWLKPSVKAEIQRIAEQEGLSISSAGRAGLEEWVRQQLHIQHTVLIQPIIETTIRNELRRYFSRMVLFQARITLTLDVIKGLVKWLCRRLAGATKEQVDLVEERSRKDARLNLQTRTPQLEKISEELEKTLMMDGEGTH